MSDETLKEITNDTTENPYEKLYNSYNNDTHMDEIEVNTLDND